ncbi:MAG: oxygenase MpaB family protein [Hyphomonadaceae bacterium]
MSLSAKELMGAPAGAPKIDFREPKGAAALVGPDSVSWRVFKNPVALFIGGVTAVLLELAEPRVRTGVWEHTTFRTDPLARMRRTGYAAMVTIYGPREAAERMIAGISRMHARVTGVTPAGQAYTAADPELLDWVQVTAGFGFMEAYHRFVRPLTDGERDRFYAEGEAAAQLYGAVGAPKSQAEAEALFASIAPKLERHEIIFEFLDIMRRVDVAPAPLRGVQRLLVRAGIALVPENIRAIIGLGREWDLPWGAETAIRAMGAAADRVVMKSAPPAQACERLGLPANYLYRAPARSGPERAA